MILTENFPGLQNYVAVHSFFAGRDPAYSGSQHWDHIAVQYAVRLPRERKVIDRCVRCVLATCGEDRLSRNQQLVGYFYSVPLLDVAYYLA